MAAEEQGEGQSERAFPRCGRKGEWWSERSGLSVTPAPEAPTLVSEERSMGSTDPRFLKAAERWVGEENVERNWSPQGCTPIRNVVMEEGEGGVPSGPRRVEQTFSTLETRAWSTEVGRPGTGQRPKDRFMEEEWAGETSAGKGLDGRMCG